MRGAREQRFQFVVDRGDTPAGLFLEGMRDEMGAVDGVVFAYEHDGEGVP